MRRAFVLAVGFATVLAPGPARADGPVVDVADLPPLPPAEDAPSSSATVLAAATAEEDVVVGAAKREQSLGNVASAVTVITADRIRRFGYRTVAEALAGVAGVYIQDTRLTSSVGIRGLLIPGGFNSRVLVLVDGATVNEAWGAFGGVGFDGLVSIDDIARIEVIRGPVGAVYGTNAFFAILNIVTRGALEGSKAWGRIGINSINGAVGTAGFAQGGVNQQIRGSVLVMSRIGESSTIPAISSSPLEGDGANTVIAAVVGTHGGSFGQVRAYRSKRDSPFAPYDSDPVNDPAYSLFNYQLLVEGGHTRELSKRLSASGRGYLNLYRYADRIYNTSDVFLDYGDAKTIGAEVRGRYELRADGKLGITAGVEANYNITKSRAFTDGMEASGVVVPLDFDTEGVYSELDGQPTAWLGFTGGLRFDRRHIPSNGLPASDPDVREAKTTTRLSPRAAVFLAKKEEYGAKLLYAEGFRNPSAFEGYFKDDVDFSANPNIRPETIRSFEAVLWARPAIGLSTRLSGFYWDARDVVEQLPDPMNPARLQFQNVGRYISQGVEVEATYRNSAGWYGFGGATLARVGSGSTGGKVAFGDVVDAPAVTATAGASTPKLFDRAHLSGELVFLSSRHTRPDDTGTPLTSKAWASVDLTVYVPDVRGFDLTAGVRNLIGRRDEIPAPGDYDRFPDPATTITVPKIPGEGREFFIKVGYSH
ncbi:MAG: TonB-dependent receptor [Myxococcales bacterium]|nr:TonB-dependent receptor [Myxococcales bacterium]